MSQGRTEDQSGRVDVSESVSISTGIADRYATAVFEIANGEGAIDALSTDLDQIETALKESDDFRALITSPVYSREEQGKAVAAIAAKMGLGKTLANTLGLMAAKRRLFVVPQLAAALRAKIADAKGIVTAEVTAAGALSEEQTSALAAILKDKAGKDVEMSITVDESLIGGMIVKLGSQMIDTSVRAKLNALKNSMKEVG